MAAGCVGGVEDEDDLATYGYIDRLKYDLANSYYWSGHFVKDYIFFVMQWHPLLGVFMCHPNHPWTKLRRVWMLLISAALTFIPSIIIVKNTEAFVSHEKMRLIDTGISEANAEITAKALGATTQTIATLFWVTLPDTIIGVVLYQLAIAETRVCPCCPCKEGLKSCARQLMKGGICVALLLVVISLGGANFVLGGLADNLTMEYLQPLIVGKLYSYLFWFPMWIFLPCQLGFLSLWFAESKALAKERGGAE